MKQPAAAKKLLEKIGQKKARVGIIGLGYVGLPLGVEFVRAGFEVIGVDVDANKIKAVQQGKSYLVDLTDDEIQETLATGRLRVSTRYADLAKADAVSITVPTPLRKSKDPDVSFIQQAVEGLSKVIRPGTLVVLESTTYPGTTRELVEARLEKEGLLSGENLFVAFSPERIDPGNMVWKTRNIPKVVGGTTPEATELAAALYAGAVERVVRVGSSEEAEMVKLLENTFRAVNIALVNELMLMCDRMGIDVWNVIGAAATKPFGFMPFYPGPGIGGHCIPLDPMYLAWRARAYDYTNRFIELATDINGNMPRFVLNKAARLLSRKRKKALKGARVLLLGMAYKPGVTDTRESPGLEVLRLLEREGARVAYSDPHVPVLIEGEKKLRSQKITPKALASCDLAVLLTAHPEFDYPLIARHAPLVLDTRNAFGEAPSSRVERL
ncbi:MAG: nucleotide sugar dehydrogenase [Bdellovibrionota bacterium]